MTIDDALLMVKDRDIRNLGFSDEDSKMAVTRRFLEEYPQFRDDEIILINTLSMEDPNHSKNLRDHIGLHPSTMMGVAEHTDQKEINSIAELFQSWLSGSSTKNLCIVTVCKKERHRSIASRELLTHFVETSERFWNRRR